MRVGPANTPRLLGARNACAGAHTLWCTRQRTSTVTRSVSGISSLSAASSASVPPLSLPPLSLPPLSLPPLSLPPFDLVVSRGFSCASAVMVPGYQRPLPPIVALHSSPDRERLHGQLRALALSRGVALRLWWHEALGGCAEGRDVVRVRDALAVPLPRLRHAVGVQGGVRPKRHDIGRAGPPLSYPKKNSNSSPRYHLRGMFPASPTHHNHVVRPRVALG